MLRPLRLLLLVRVLLAGSFVVAWMGIAAAPATAQAPVSSCPASGLSLARVEIVSPRSGSTLTAGFQRVTGRVVSGLNRVELYVDGVLSDARQLGVDQEDFELGWQAVAPLPRSASITVVACGTGIGQLLRGMAEVTVRLTPVDTTRLAPSSTVATPGATVRPTSTAVPGSTTVARGQAVTGSSLVTTTGVPTTEPAPVQPPVSGPPGTTATRPANEPLVLSERPEENEPGPPLWVGAVVGLSGTIGLALSAVFSRRSAARAAQQQLPADDLHDEGSDLVSL